MRSLQAKKTLYTASVIIAVLGVAFAMASSDVTFGYHENEVLHGVNMSIESGTVNALVGSSGSGKSTIAKLIASLWDVKNGSIKIGGMDIGNLSQEEYNRRVAYVSQETLSVRISAWVI